jgi:CPA2 family monovalent cation:H+ antiporter-2
VAAGLGAFVAGRLRLSPILGFLVAGIVIGPFTPGYVARSGTIEQLAELGLIFLLFSLGLGFSVSEVRAIGALPVAGNLVVMALIGVVLWAVAAFLHLPHAITLALILTLSSTAIGVALLRQWRLDETRLGRLVVASLVVQDLVAAALLVLVSTPADSLTAIGVLAPLVRAVAFVAVALVAGATVLHRLVVRLLHGAASETLFGAFAALALTSAWLGQLAGLSFEFGAFIAGAVVSEAAGSRMVQSIVEPFRALFLSLFFVAMGMAVDPGLIRTHWIVIVVIGGAFVVVRMLAWGALGRIAGFSAAAATLIGIAMLPLGEFNIALVNAAAAAHRVTRDERGILLGITFLSIGLATIGGSLAASRRALVALELELQTE